VSRFLRNIIVFRQSLSRASAAGKLLFIDPFPHCRPKSKQLAELRLAAAKGGLHEHQFQVRIDKNVLSAQASKREPPGVCRIPNLISVSHQKRCRNRIGGRRCEPVLGYHSLAEPITAIGQGGEIGVRVRFPSITQSREISLAVDRRGPAAPLPERSGSAIRRVDVKFLTLCRVSCWVFGANFRIVMSSIMRRRNGLIVWSVMGKLLSGGRVATPHLQTGSASYLSKQRATGGGAARAGSVL
jgi:hypothetical protein